MAHKIIGTALGFVAGIVSIPIVNIAWASIGAILTLIVVAASFAVGKYYGYWKRVSEEKSARDIP